MMPSLALSSLNLPDLNEKMSAIPRIQLSDWSGNIGTARVTGEVFLTAVLSPAPAIVAVNTTAAQTFTVRGLVFGSVVTVNKPTEQAGLGIVGARVSATDTLVITFSNNTGAGITPTATDVYLIHAVRSA